MMEAGILQKQAERSLATAKGILDRAESANRDLTPDEAASVDALRRDAESSFAAMKEAMNPPAWNAGTRKVPPQPIDYGPGGRVRSHHTTVDSEYVDPASGRPIPRLGKEQRFADLVDNPWPEIKNPLGEIICAQVSGRSARHLPAELRTMSTAIAAAGGYLCPEEVSANVIDRARARSVLVRAGAQTLPMTTGTAFIARIEGDVTIENKSENAAFTSSDVTLGGISLAAMTFGSYTVMSRELMADALNGPSAIENAIASALATQIDTWGLTGGTGGSDPLGLLYQTGVNTIGSVGSPLWTDFLDAMELILADNFDPKTVIYSPNTWNSLASIYTGDGTNSAKFFQPPPPEVAPLQKLVTSACPDANAFVGDFNEFAIVVRQEIAIEISTEAGDTFQKNQAAIKSTWRGTYAALRPTAFCVLSGIS